METNIKIHRRNRKEDCLLDVSVEISKTLLPEEYKQITDAINVLASFVPEEVEVEDNQ